MNKNNIVTINGQQYDALTGLPVSGSSVAPAKKPTPANSIHSSLQRSKTLIRRVTKKPSPISNHRPKNPGRTMDIAKSSKISRFAPHTVVAPVVQVVEKPDVPAPPYDASSKKILGERPTCRNSYAPCC